MRVSYVHTPAHKMLSCGFACIIVTDIDNIGVEGVIENKGKISDLNSPIQIIVDVDSMDAAFELGG